MSAEPTSPEGRRHLLVTALQAVGLELRDDSKVCKAYIQGGAARVGAMLRAPILGVMDVVEICEEMAFLHTRTAYVQLRRQYAAAFSEVVTGSDIRLYAKLHAVHLFVWEQLNLGLTWQACLDQLPFALHRKVLLTMHPDMTADNIMLDVTHLKNGWAPVSRFAWMLDAQRATTATGLCPALAPRAPLAAHPRLRAPASLPAETSTFVAADVPPTTVSTTPSVSLAWTSMLED